MRNEEWEGCAYVMAGAYYIKCRMQSAKSAKGARAEIAKKCSSRFREWFFFAAFACILFCDFWLKRPGTTCKLGSHSLRAPNLQTHHRNCFHSSDSSACLIERFLTVNKWVMYCFNTSLSNTRPIRPNGVS